MQGCSCPRQAHSPQRDEVLLPHSLLQVFAVLHPTQCGLHSTPQLRMQMRHGLLSLLHLQGIVPAGQARPGQAKASHQQ